MSGAAAPDTPTFQPLSTVPLACESCSTSVDGLTFALAWAHHALMSSLAPALAAAASEQFGCFLSDQALLAGYTPSEIQSATRSGAWRRLRRGAYCTAEWWLAADDVARHLVVARAAQLQLGARSPLSHSSAALLHGLPLVGPIPSQPELTVQREHRSAATGTKLHSARLFPSHVMKIRGADVTTPARTVSDLARTAPLVTAVSAGDAALRSGVLTESDFDPVLKDCWTWRGIARTKRVIPLLDARSESVGESISRVRMIEHRIPRPELQYVIVINGRSFRTDFAWPALRIVGEFDGRIKYGGPDDLFSEKRREDAIRREGWLVVRWVWEELWGEVPAFVRRLRPVMEQQRRAISA